MEREVEWLDSTLDLVLPSPSLLTVVLVMFRCELAEDYKAASVKFVPCHRKRKSRLHRSCMARALFTPSPSIHTPTSEDHQTGYVNSCYILWLHYSSQTQVISYLRKAVFVIDGHGAKIGRGLFIRKGTLVHLCTFILLLPSRVGRDCCRLDAVTL